MKKTIKFISSALVIILCSTVAEAQIKKVYNEQQLIMLEQQGLLHTVDESQISEKAKDTKIYKLFKGEVVSDPWFRKKRKKCTQKKED